MKAISGYFADDSIIERFSKLYYDSHVWRHNYYLGHLTEKCIFDLWMIQEIIWKTKPDIIIETGTGVGGSTLFMADVLGKIGKGLVVTVDKENRGCPEHEYIWPIIGDSKDISTLNKVKENIEPSFKVMVDLDSNHETDHVLAELKLYAPLVTKDCYLVAEDTNLEHVSWAVRQYLEIERDKWEINREYEKLFLTFNPMGYLKRK